MIVCGKCKKLFETHECFKSVMCSGPCSGQFHKECANLNENEISCLKISSNIKWFCDSCLVTGSIGIKANDSSENITGKLLKQFEIQENILCDIQNRLKYLENERNMKNAKDINSALEPSGKRKKLIIAGVLSVMVLLIVAAVLGSKALSNSKNTNGNEANDDYECSGNGTLCYIDRDVWRAHPRKDGWNKQTLPLDSVIIAHTATEECHNVNVCAERVRIIQEFHMGSYGWSDIGYNFLISSDGKVYVGRGWNIEGAHTKGYNKGSVGIAFIGTFVKDRPSDEQLKACQALLEEGVHLKKLTPNYRLYGARQLSATESPGATLYNIIKKWPNWTVDVKKNT